MRAQEQKQFSRAAQFGMCAAAITLALVFNAGCERGKAAKTAEEQVATERIENVQAVAATPPRFRRVAVPGDASQPSAVEPQSNQTVTNAVDPKLIQEAQKRGLEFEDVLRRAEQGEVKAQTELANIYATCSKYKESNPWLMKAAEAGDAGAQHILGTRYVTGMGIEKNPELAVQWFLRSAEQGNPLAQHAVGVRYVRGDGGLEKNIEEAAKWFYLSAQQGEAAAQVSVGRRYAAGDGTVPDKIEAYKWFALAAAKHHMDAGGLRDEVAREMTPEQIAEAEKRAHAFVPQRGLKP